MSKAPQVRLHQRTEQNSENRVLLPQVPLAEGFRPAEQVPGGVVHPPDRRRRRLQDPTLRTLQTHESAPARHLAVRGHVRRLHRRRQLLLLAGTIVGQESTADGSLPT